MALPDQKDVTFHLLHVTIRFRTGHGLPSAERHSHIEESDLWPLRCNPIEEEFPSKPGRRRCGPARDGYESGKCLLLGSQGDPKSRTPSPRGERIVQHGSSKRRSSSST